MFVLSLGVLCSSLLLEVLLNTRMILKKTFVILINTFVTYAEALSRLNAVIQHPNALHPDNVMAYDNAVSALGKICQFHQDSIDSAQVFICFPCFSFTCFYGFVLQPCLTILRSIVTV